MKKIFTEFQNKVSSLTIVQKVLLFAGTLLVLSAGFYFLMFQNQLDTISRLDGQIANEQKTLASLKAAAARVKIITREIAQSQEELHKLLMLLPDQKEIPGLLESVSRLGANVGLENILFQPEPEVFNEFYATIPVRLDLVGAFDNLGVFLDSVSKLDRILKVQSLKLVRQNDKDTALLQVTCEIVTYRFLNKPAGNNTARKKTR